VSRRVAVTEVKITLAGRRQEFPCCLVDRSRTRAVLFYPVPSRRRVGPLVLPRGTESYGYFWRDRPYTVYHWVAPDGRTLGVYVNLAEGVVLRPREVRWRDLALDLLFRADGARVQVLDEPEVRALPDGLRARIEAARAQVLSHRDALLAEVLSATARLRRRVRARRRGEDSGGRPRTP